MSFADLPEPPSDAISSLRFSPDGSGLLVSAWDSFRIYRLSEDGSFRPAVAVDHIPPVLDVCWGHVSTYFFTVGLGQDVTRRDFPPAGLDGMTTDMAFSKTVMSTHGNTSNKVAFSPDWHLLLSTGWDSTLHVHDTLNGRYLSMQLPRKPFALALTADRAVIAMSERLVYVYSLPTLRSDLEDLIKLQDSGQVKAQDTIPTIPPWQTRESSLRFMTRDLACMPDGRGFAISSIEGRCGVEWFDPEQQQKKFAFKCHREKQTFAKGEGDDGVTAEVDVIYPVNALAFHPVHGTFVTGGGDGVVAFWDPQTKRRIRTLPKQVSCVAAMDFSPDGRFLAIGVSPGFEDGREAEEFNPAEIKVIVRRLDKNEAKAKPVKAAATAKKAKTEDIVMEGT